MASQFKNLPLRGSLSVDEAITAGNKAIHQPTFCLMLIGMVAGILGWIFLAWWVGLLFGGSGLLAGYIYTQSATPAWRNWAYSGVRDIHQLQRSAELERLLPLESFDKLYGWMSYGQIQILNSLFDRFKEDEPFEEDLSIPETLTVARFDRFFQKMGIVYLQLNADGIRLSDTSFYPWSEVRGAEVVYKSYSNDQIVYSIEFNKPAFGFHCREGYIEIPLEEIGVEVTQLDYLLYVYQGRFERKPDVVKKYDHDSLHFPKKG